MSEVKMKMMDGNRSRRFGCPSYERSMRYLSDYPVVADGRMG